MTYIHSNAYYRSCTPSGFIEIRDTRIRLENPHGKKAIHRFYQDMTEAYRQDGRFLDHPCSYERELRNHGFVNVIEHVYLLPLSGEEPHGLRGQIVQNWARGLETYSLELMNTRLEKRHSEILLGCALARRDIRNGVGGFLEM